VRGLAVSLLVHAGIIAAGMFYLPRAMQVLETVPYVPIDLVTVADTTNVVAAAPEIEPETEDEAADEATIEDEIVDPAPAPEPEPAPEVEPEYFDPDPEEIVEPDPVEDEPEPDPEPEPVREEPRPAEPVVEQPREPSFADLLDDLGREVETAREENNANEQGDRRRGVGTGETNTATLQVILQNHISRCWRNSLDAPHPDELAVEVMLTLDRSGELQGPPRLVDQSRILASPNPYLRVAGERALRAASVCAPYPLPVDQYSQWRQITVNFAPSLYGP
jgi:outer membrane biosynthesis protein TonB